ncbi:hypothetical protein CHS0354_020895 [Potamilus streckersoni]|uniref:JmjC domain-containing protein n=1 Tax=Potamilus streckersoni TaxID=2493646 RepID=A0AAE0W1N5_9BIVA|nr:hypothetical protein CHS0354_020895 [Potamilus streckersoni]
MAGWMRMGMILFHIFIASFIHLNQIIVVSSGFLDTFTPAEIQSRINLINVVAVDENADNELITVVEKLASVAFWEEHGVMIGKIDLSNFVWPSGEALKIQHLPTKKEPSDKDVSVLIFPKRVLDRTCLSTPPPGPPTAKLCTGEQSYEALVECVNSICNTYRLPSGALSIAGLHREEILNTLFHVGHFSNMSMGQLFGKSRSLLSSFHKEESCPDKESSQKSSNEVDNNEAFIYTNIQESSLKNVIHQCEKRNLLSKEDFFHNYLKISKPVIIKGALDDWPALQKWSNSFLRKEYGERDVHIKFTPTGEYEGVEKASLYENFDTFKIPSNVRKQLEFPDLVVVRPATANVKFSEFMDIVESVTNGSRKNISAYLEYSSIPQHMPELEKDIMEMPFFSNLLKREHLNIWLSDGNTLGKLHFDPYDNFLCQISGRKQITLFEPHENTQLYEAHIPEAILSFNKSTGEFHRKALLDSTSMVMSPVDILKPDFTRFPRFADAYPMSCTIEEGDVLFMPAFWWHEVQSFPNKTAGRNLAVNFWYEPFLTKEFPCPLCNLDINPKYRHLL